MGLSNSGSQIRYIHIVYGKFAIRCNPGTPGSIVRKNKLNEEVYELHYDTLNGILANIQASDSQYGRDWIFDILDNDTTYKVQIPQNIGTSIGILGRLPNIDLKEKIRIKIYYIEEKTHLVVYQSGRKLPSAYTRDNPNGLPPLEKVTLNGKAQWDSTKRTAYLEKLVAEMFPANEEVDQAAEEYDQAESTYMGEPTGDDDLPF